MIDINRGLTAAGTWFVVSYGFAVVLGVNVSVMEVAESAAYMGGSAVVSDWLHSAWHMYPTTVTSAVGTGVVFAAAQALGKGSDAYLANVAAGATTDVAASYVERMVYPSSNNEDYTPDDGAVSTA